MVRSVATAAAAAAAVAAAAAAAAAGQQGSEAHDPAALPPGLVGIVNLGNTCFMSSVLQVLLHSPILRHFFLAAAATAPDYAQRSTQHAQLIAELDELFQEAYTTQRGVVVPVKFLSASWSASDHMAEYRQQDAHEFYLSMLSALDTIDVCSAAPPPPPGAPAQSESLAQHADPAKAAAAPAAPVPLEAPAPQLACTASPAANALDSPSARDAPTLPAAPAARGGTLPPLRASPGPLQPSPGSGAGGADPQPAPPAQPRPTLASLVFGGELRSDVTCCACGHTSTTYDPVMDIAIDLDAEACATLPPPPPNISPAGSNITGHYSGSTATPGPSRAATPELSADDAPPETCRQTRTAARASAAQPLSNAFHSSTNSGAMNETGKSKRTLAPGSILALALSGQLEASAMSAVDVAECFSPAISDSPRSAQALSTEAATSTVVPAPEQLSDEALEGALQPRLESVEGCDDQQAESEVARAAAPARAKTRGAAEAALPKKRAHERGAAASVAPTRKTRRPPSSPTPDTSPDSFSQPPDAGELKVFGSPTALTLTSCLARFTQPERLSAGSWTCARCGVGAAALKQLSVRKLPPVLCFHVKRFRLDSKLEVPLAFPTGVLDMRPFLSSSIVARRRGLRGPSPAQQRLRGAGLYQLMAIVQHSGSLHGGHYVMYLRLDSRWFLCDDAQVSQVPQSVAAKAEPYMLFYTHCQL